MPNAIVPRGAAFPSSALWLTARAVALGWGALGVSVAVAAMAQRPQRPPPPPPPTATAPPPAAAQAPAAAPERRGTAALELPAALASGEQAWLARALASPGPPPGGAPSALTADLAAWDWLRHAPASGALAAPPLEAARFARRQPDWPGVAAIRRRAELAAADRLTPDATALAVFEELAPETASGRARFALLLADRDRLAVGRPMAEAAWGMTGMDPTLEAQLLQRFGGELTTARHDARADALVWAGQTTAAQRMLTLVSADSRALTQARLALRGDRPEARALADSVPAGVRAHPGLLFDRVAWLERQGQTAEAERLLAATRTTQGAVAAPRPWLQRRLALGRAAMRRGDARRAYDILAHHRTYPESTALAQLPLAERVDLSDTEWLAGWVALRRLDRPTDAAAHFERFLAIVTTPVSQSRGNYWLGRAERARGRESEARRAFEAAAVHFDYFYGQLAVEALGREVRLPETRRASVAASEARAFAERGDVRALVALGAMGDRGRQSLFVRSVASSVATPAEFQLASELAEPLGRPDLAVWTWKSARPLGELSTFALAYPRLPADAGLEDDRWIVAHAIARQESSFDRTAISPVGARGLMQLMPATARDVAGRLDLPFNEARLLTDPAYNIRLGGFYIDLRRRNLGGNDMLAMAAYNAGIGRPRQWLTTLGAPGRGEQAIDWVEMIPIQETRNYVQRVTENAVVYSLLEPRRGDARPRASAWLEPR